MKREGGVDIKDHVKRVIGKLLAPDLQSQINRKGGYGKEKFHTYLEDGIKGKLVKYYDMFSL